MKDVLCLAASRWPKALLLLTVMMTPSACKSSGSSGAKALGNRPQCTSQGGRGYGDLWPCDQGTCSKQNPDYTDECVANAAKSSSSNGPESQPAPAAVATGQSQVTSFQISCSTGAHLSGNYGDNASMCTALNGMQGTCQEAQTFYQTNCGTTGTSTSDTSSSSAQTPNANPSSQAGTATSFNVNCSNGSNYNGSYSSHAAMCRHLQDKLNNCPAEVQAALNSLGC